MNSKDAVTEQLLKQPEHKDKLFSYGFVYSEQNHDSSEYPFFSLWKSQAIYAADSFLGNLITHPRTHSYVRRAAKFTVALVGHAYNPVTMEHDEQSILDSIILACEKDGFFEYFNQLTGVFTLAFFSNEGIYVFGDATGMQTTYYGVISGKRYISSHINLLGDLLKLETDEYVSKLTAYKYFPLLGSAMPSDLTNFKQIKRLIPNHYVMLADDASVVRFFSPTRLNLMKDEIAKRVSELISANLELITRKWARPAISLTGGCDSKTTLSCANGIYDKFSYFSYISSEEERVDAEAASRICKALGIPHRIYEISDDDGNYSDLECHKSLLFHNAGSARETNPNDVRKRCFFAQISDFDVEVKSWCSEVGRAYFSKRFNGKKKFGRITARKCTTMYKFFLHNRRLVRQTDKHFKDYIKKYMSNVGKVDSLTEWQEQFFWEFRMSAWNGNVITGEHRYSFDITIPYNNRLLLQLLLSVPLKDRIADTVYSEIRKRMNPAIDECGISVTNVKHTTNRARAERIYYTIHSKFPF